MCELAATPGPSQCISTVQRQISVNDKYVSLSTNINTFLRCICPLVNTLWCPQMCLPVYKQIPSNLNKCKTIHKYNMTVPGPPVAIWRYVFMSLSSFYLFSCTCTSTHVTQSTFLPMFHTTTLDDRWR